MPSDPMPPKPLLVALGAYGVALATVAFWPTPVDRPLAGLFNRALTRLHGLGAPGWVNYSFVEFAANVALFVPLGFLVAAIAGRRHAWLGMAAGFAISLGIEVVQWLLLPQRFPAASDVLANTMGAALGALFLTFVVRERRRQSA